LGFVLGLVIDMFSNTMGLHAFATVLVAFLYAPVIRLFVSSEENISLQPSVNSFGIGGYLKFAVILIVIHHMVLFFLEAFTFTNFWLTLFRALLSSACTFLVVIGVQFFSISKNK
jgi:rod shape-determining protein MreD